MKTSFALRLAAALLAVVPGARSAEPETVTKVVHVRYASPDKLADLIWTTAEIKVKSDNVLKVLVLGGRSEDVAAIEHVIQELDQPSAGATDARDIELDIYVIGASSKAPTGGESSIVAGLDPVVKQIRAAFPYKNIQLLTSSSIRSRTGEHSFTRGFFGLGEQEALYDVGFERSEASAGANGQRSIHLSKFSFNCSVKSHKIEVSSDLDLREGQKVVVGKAGAGSDDSALFVVLSARVVD